MLVVLLDQALQLLPDLVDARLPQRVPELLGHETLVDAIVADVGVRAQVPVDHDALVDVIVHLRRVPAGRVEDHRGPAGVTVGELCEVVNLAIDCDPAVLRSAMAAHLRLRDALRDGSRWRPMQQALLPLGDGRGHALVRLPVVHHPLVDLELVLLRVGLMAVGAAEEALGGVGGRHDAETQARRISRSRLCEWRCPRIRATPQG
mmetsp:Transcript_15150/g.34921  ORF Transcript_15150/g.34921 Transcript_15150/m.34921 type:complete len:205 (+) Transcript_15150:1084-1698(+)